MNRSTWIGRLFRRDRMQARAELLRVLRRYGGNVKNASVDLGLRRRTVFRYLWRESLWHELDAIRAEARTKRCPAVDPDASWIERARVQLRADVRRTA